MVFAVLRLLRDTREVGGERFLEHLIEGGKPVSILILLSACRGKTWQAVFLLGTMIRTRV